ncbi:exodeoxyribonuclease VII small subunit [Lentimicrobium sp.]|jgi:exodeoxyribonuclease VII small subunit|uniref:exodeoxyribonuclease VII small subunit n=1 Tax=Lentimicrobium sp. TaxID=2034841 RepID=UPI0025D2398B|nr:exodeoxyribonuclease VII small subunit [Lentimicrobium sp.]MCO5256769.1 exodeoxyribonuclease VII small subunit [Lentimicrobium sp.]MCO5261503.1 exodeoxyribonuclease VII small subunit [Lentimicrobium sp.]HOP13555.1 exodeoxyribonuclease VII small subunit [Lentimicrobium sp.]HPF63314.1 exodeoxyribonuclease VII small subunit [Lentimicrobium sp.]HPJ63477.1 exodeoxyribonuclease VII small subunit [Lentimicrobium sp.]
MSKSITYTQAIAELETIVSEIENASIGVDELSEKVKRAAELIRFCRNKLTSTEKEVNSILKSIEEESAE